jgi:hypothetical protein
MRILNVEAGYLSSISWDHVSWESYRLVNTVEGKILRSFRNVVAISARDAAPVKKLYRIRSTFLEPHPQDLEERVRRCREDPEKRRTQLRRLHALCRRPPQA